MKDSIFITGNKKLMKRNIPLFLTNILYCCSFLSYIIAAAHYVILMTGLLRLPFCIYSAPGGLYINLHHIWFARLFRRVVSLLVRSPLRIKTLQLVDFTAPITNTGCIITTCHTPWARLLVQWCLQNKFALIIVSGIWLQRAKAINKYGKGFPELRYLVRHLQSGGRIIITSDAMLNSKNCAVHFFEKECNVSLLPARLARIAKVPIIAVVPELRNQSILINEGPRYYLKQLLSNQGEVIQSMLTYYENEIKKSPAIWAEFVH